MSPLLHPVRSRLAPVLSREGIRWRTVAPEIVEITVDLSNPGTEATAEGELVIETAALGAFVPFTPVTRVALGSMEPGGRRQVVARVRRQMLENPFSALADLLKGQKNAPSADFIDLLSRSEWAGNLNVYFDRAPEQAVEVHRALGLRVRAGRPVALVLVLPPDTGEYAVGIRVSSPEWRAEIGSMLQTAHFLLVSPPSSAGVPGKITVDVTRLSDGKTVPVEFALETVDGAGENLGCVRI